jgi:hypothetical protein
MCTKGDDAERARLHRRLVVAPGEALRQAQLAILKSKGREHPFYWASFIESSELANREGRR